MKKETKSKERTLLKTTMVALFITALLLMSSVNAAPLVTQPSSKMSTQGLDEPQMSNVNAASLVTQPSSKTSAQELDELQAHQSTNLRFITSSDNKNDNLQDPSLGYRANDVGVVSIDAPVNGLAAGAYTPKATVKNFGSNNLTNVPVQFQIGNATPGSGLFYNFESDNGGWIISASWAPYIGDWEWTNTYNVANYVYGAYPTSEKPPLTAYSGTGLWGTKMYAPYTNAGGFSYLSKTFDFSSLTNPTISWRSWEQVFGNFDYCQLRVNGNLVWGPSWDYAAPQWRERVVNLANYSGLASVEIKFEMYATTVVNYAGWYIDDVLIAAAKQRLPTDNATVLEYNQTKLVTLNAGQSVQVEFPTWIPNVWHHQENVTIPYNLSVKTNLVNDTNTSNNLRAKVINLNYGLYHDITLTSIVKPVSGNAGVIAPEVVVKNLGQYNETNVPIHMVISKPYFMQDFVSTTFPPAGWTQEATNEWRRVTTANAGGTSPEARLYYSYIVGNYAYLQSPAIDTTGDTQLRLDFRSMIQNQYGGSNCKVLIRNNALANWTDITPWSNPINANVPKAKYTLDVSAYIGNGTQVRFQFNGTSAGIMYWYLDDIFLYQLDTPDYEYTKYITINSGVEQNVIFPTWTPSDFGTAQNVNIFYKVLAQSELATDNKTVNNIQRKDIILYYPFIHDVAVTQILSPVNGLAQTQPVKVAVKNNGQNDESVNVNVVIEKFNGTTEGFETSNGGYVAGGTGTTPWQWGTPTSGPSGAHSGTKLWATNLAGNYAACNVTLDKAVTLSSGSVSLTFWHWYDTEPSYDGGNVKISTNGGATWTLLIPDGGYTGTGNTVSPLKLQPMWTGHVQKYWEKESFNLNAYAGQSVIVRWHFGADPSVFYPGWYIDDICFADPSSFIPEYNESTSADIAVGETINVTLDDWTPSDLTLSYGIDYRATATVTIAGYTDVVTENFNNYAPAHYIMPTEWTVVPSNPTSTWFIDQTGTTAKCQETGKLNLAQNEVLKSPAFVTTGMAVVKIQYNAYMYRALTNGDSQVEVKGSLDGGVSYPYLIKTYNTPGGTTYAEDITISTWAANQPSVTIGYVFSSPAADINYTDYFYFDNFWIGNEVPVITESFNNVVAGYYNWPTGWTTTITNPTGKWYIYQSSQYPKVNESGSNGGAQDEWAISKVYDCSALTAVQLSFTGYFYNYSGSNSKGEVRGSIDGGATWPYYIVNFTTSGIAPAAAYNLPWAVGQVNVKIAWHFISGADAVLTDNWYFDNVVVGYNWGPYGDNPPSGWTILNYGSQSPQVWDSNDWYRYSYGGTQGQVARVYYSPIEATQNELLISPSINCAALTSVNLSFWHYWNSGVATQKGWVNGSTDGGVTFPYPIAAFATTSEGPLIKTYDISSWAAGQANVKIQYQYRDASGNGYYWNIDDFKISSGTTTIYSQNFEGVGPIAETFSTNYVPPSWGPLGWQLAPPGDVHWVKSLTANAGGLSPELMFTYAPVATGNYSFYSAPIDTSLYTALTLSFKHYVSHYSTPYTLKVETSTDGTTWGTVWSISPTGNILASTVSLSLTGSQGIGSLTFRMRFTFSGYTNNINQWYIDDIKFGQSQTIYTTSFNTNLVPTTWGPLGWGTDKPSNWMISYTTNAGGTSPEAKFSWTPSAVAEFHLYTGPIDTSAYTALIMEFKEKISGYYGPYTLKVDTSIDNITWNTAYSFSPTASIGPRTTTIPLTTANGIGSTTFRFRFTFSGDSYNIDYWYIDNIKFKKLVTMPDGNVTNDVLVKWVTLSYEHDVGVSMITEPVGPITQTTKTWSTGTTTNAFNDGGFLFETAQRYNITDMSAFHNWTISKVQFFKGYGTTAVPACSGRIKIYSSTNASQPTTLITTQAWSVGVGSFWVDVYLDSPVKILPGVDYWVSVEHTAGYASTTFMAGCDNGPAVFYKGGWMWDETTPWTEIRTWGYSYNWNIKTVLNSPVSAAWPPASYPIAAVVGNYGVTFAENNFVVNAKVFKTSKADVLVYQQNVTVTSALAPGQNVLKAFPNIVIANVTASEGNYRLEITTMLVGDDHPTNDKKTKTFTIVKSDNLPPVTTHTFAGTTGNNGWYKSNVTITLAAGDPTPPYRTIGGGKGPSGVNHTYYKIDTGSFIEYTVPVKVSADGQHQVWYYSVDKKGNKEADKGPFSFKMDKTMPEWINYSFTKLNLLGTKWMCAANVTDATSGIVKVEFYVDDALVANDSEAPYEFEFHGKPTTSSQAIAYDAAGNSAMSLIASSLEYSNQAAQQQSHPSTQTVQKKNI